MMLTELIRGSSNWRLHGNLAFRHIGIASHISSKDSIQMVSKTLLSLFMGNGIGPVRMPRRVLAIG